jgi:hypothetical protein
MKLHDHINDAEDASFDATMKVMGMVVALGVIAAIAAWYISS